MHYRFGCSMCGSDYNSDNDSDIESDTGNISNEFPPDGSPKQWCDHFISHHLKHYQNQRKGPSKRCNFIYELLHEAVIHYKTKHALFYSSCRICARELPSLEAGRHHEQTGCGEFMICGGCQKPFYGREEIEKHKKPKSCKSTPNGVGYEGLNDEDIDFIRDIFIVVNDL